MGATTQPEVLGGHVTEAVCGVCVHFSNAPEVLEKAFPGLSVMSSGHASVRGQDGLCARHGVYLSFNACCADFERIKGG